MDLSTLGLTDALADRFAGHVPDGFEPARVVAVNRTNVELGTASGVVTAELAGRLRFGADPVDLPAVGDWVVSQMLDEGTFALVTDVLPRATVLRRQTAGKRVDVQLIATNVDTAFIVQPADTPVHTRRLERYAVIVRDGGADPVIVLSKSDRCSDIDAARRAAAAICEVVVTSAVSEAGLDELTARVRPGETHVFIGPSGVGKSTLMNGLADRPMFATQSVRESDGKGRHTTTRRELVVLPSGGIVIDTPGMRELGLTDVGEGIASSFDDIETLADRCRFRDCTHTGEAGCAVADAVSSGDLNSNRLEHYLKLQREAAHFSRSVKDQRQHDRELGKLYKSILKGKKDRR